MMAFLTIHGSSTRTFSNYYFAISQEKTPEINEKKNFFSLNLKIFVKPASIMDQIIDYFALFTYYSQSRIDARLWMRCLERI